MAQLPNLDIFQLGKKLRAGWWNWSYWTILMSINLAFIFIYDIIVYLILIIIQTKPQKIIILIIIAQKHNGCAPLPHHISASMHPNPTKQFIFFVFSNKSGPHDGTLVNEMLLGRSQSPFWGSSWAWTVKAHPYHHPVLPTTISSSQTCLRGSTENQRWPRMI